MISNALELSPLEISDEKNEASTPSDLMKEYQDLSDKVEQVIRKIKSRKTKNSIQ